jgi:hypothetical protein
MYTESPKLQIPLWHNNIESQLSNPPNTSRLPANNKATRELNRPGESGDFLI